jgi:hypothetical protein
LIEMTSCPFSIFPDAAGGDGAPLMARVRKKRKAEAPPATPLEALMHEHLNWLRERNYSGYTVRGPRGIRAAPRDS